jgi:hypothetical protein
MEAFLGARHPASGWMPLQKLDKVERPERIERLNPRTLDPSKPIIFEKEK